MANLAKGLELLKVFFILICVDNSLPSQLVVIFYLTIGRGGATGNFNRAPGSGPQNQQNTNVAKKNTLKFDEEYDFDKANSEFEELRSKTAKLKIAGKMVV